MRNAGSSSTVSTEVSRSSSGAWRFLLTRLHSLSGVLALGLFLLEHLYSNAVALLGPAAYDRQIELLQSIPFLPVLEIVFIFLPLVYHAVYGLYIAYISRNNTNAYTYSANWMFVLQRLSGIVTLIFVSYHVWEFRLRSLFLGTEINYAAVQQTLSNPWMLVFYTAGVLAATFHFANGLRTAWITWGITAGPRLQRISARLHFGLFLLLSTVGIATLLTFFSRG